MASEIRVNKINSRTGVGTITLSPTGVDFTGIATVATLKATTGIVTTLSVTGTTTLNGNLDLQDNDKILIGTGDDLEIYHDGDNSFIKDAGTGRLTIATSQLQLTNAADSAVMIRATESSTVELFHNSSKKLETTGVGASVTGTFNIGTGTSITSSSLIVNDVQYPDSGPLSNRNLIINGAMQVAQRSTSDSGITNGDTGYKICDRWRFGEHGSPSAVFTLNQSTEAPDDFKSSYKYDVTTAQSSLGAGDVIFFETKIEGQNLKQLAYGTSSAKSFTLSFYVKSTITGTFVVWFHNPNSSTACTHTYTVNAADTWERKSITVAGDTSNSLNSSNTNGLQPRFILAAGTDYTSGTASTTWGTSSMTNANRYVGQTVNIANSTSDEWLITGIQLEVGERATPFEHRSYGDELARCQRYYQELDLGTNNNVLHMVFSRFSNGSGNPFAYTCFPVTMRAAPTFSFLGSTFDSGGYTGDPSLGGSTVNGAQLNGGNSASANNTHFLRPNNGSGDYLRLTFTSEL